MLDEDAQQKLYQAAVAYLANTPKQATQKAQSLNFIDNGGPSSSMSGPLSIAILRDAGLIEKYIDLHQFWLWSPANDPELARVAFPPDLFTYYHIPESIGTFDFSTFPLKPGDFLYLYAGQHGNFEHMLVVDRVDKAGRVYSVTNVKTALGYVIQEVMLYDPQDPGVGQFYTWTDLRNGQMGLTGFGGFDLWRVASLPPQPTSQELTLADGIDQAIDTFGGGWHIYIKQVGGSIIYSRGIDDQVLIASVVKVPIAMLFFKALELSGITPDQYPDYLSIHGIGRSYAQLLQAMLVISEEDATSTLLQNVQARGLNIPPTLQAWGIHDLDVASRYSTARDVGSIFEQLYSGKLISPEGRAYILDLMNTYTPNDDTRLGVMRPLLPAGSEIYDKRGTITEQILVVADAAIVVVPTNHQQNVYIIDVFGYQGKKLTTDVKLVQCIEQIARLFGSYIISSP